MKNNWALTLGRKHSTLNKRMPLNKPIASIVFLSRSFVLLFSIVVRQLCLLHEVRANNCCVFERHFKIKENGAFLFEMSFFTLKILMFL